MTKPQRSRRRWTEEEKKELRRLAVVEKKPDKVIARILQRSSESIRKQRAALGIRRMPPGVRGTYPVEYHQIKNLELRQYRD